MALYLGVDKVAVNLSMVTEISNSSVNTNNETNTSYVKSESLSVANQANTENNFKIIFLTDLHFDDNSNSLAHANQAIQAITRVLDIDCVVFGGDYINNWVALSKSNAIEDIQNCRNTFVNQVTKELWLRGNHDTNAYPDERLSKEEAFNLIANTNAENGAIINNDDKYGNYGYIDFTDKKVRLVYLNTSDNDNMGVSAPEQESYAAPLINCHNVSAKQLQWIADNALYFTEDGWNVIFVSHLPLFYSTGSSPDWYNNHTYTDDDGNSYICNLSNASNLIQAYINKTTFSTTLNGESATKDFSGLSHYADIACGVNGHTHAFVVNTDGLVNYISVGNACNNGEKVSDDNNTYTKTESTSDDTTFDIIDFDFSNQYAYCWNYGAGYNRKISFRFSYNGNLIPLSVNEDGTPYVGTNGEDGYKTGYRINSSYSEIEADGYCVTGYMPCKHLDVIRIKDISLIGSDYIIFYDADKNPLLVSTIGGDFVEENSIHSLTIKLEACAFARLSTGITGDSILTVNEEIASSDSGSDDPGSDSNVYTNLIDTIGYEDGMRLSTSSGTTKTAEGKVTTGYIEASTGDTIRIKGLTFPDASDGMCSIGYYNNSQTFMSATYLYGSEISHPPFSVTIDGDLCTIVCTGSGITSQYIRITGIANTGANLIITKNEEITE